MEHINLPYDYDILLKMRGLNLSKFELNQTEYSIKPIDILNLEIYVELEEYFEV